MDYFQEATPIPVSLHQMGTAIKCHWKDNFEERILPLFLISKEQS
jgi:hypothetical protein